MDLMSVHVRPVRKAISIIPQVRKEFFAEMLNLIVSCRNHNCSKAVYERILIQVNLTTILKYGMLLKRYDTFRDP